MKKIIPIGIIVALTMSLLSGCGNKETSTTQDAVIKESIATKGNSEQTKETEVSEEVTAEKSTIPEEGLVIRAEATDYLVVAQKTGLFDAEFADENVTLELYSFGSGPYQNEAISSDSLDFGSMADQPAITAIANGYPETIIATRSTSTGTVFLVVPPDSDINSVQDIIGKDVAVTVGSTMQYVLINMLQAEGYKQDDINVVNAAGEDALTLVLSNEVDASVIAGETAAEAINKGTLRGIANTGDYGIETTHVVIANNKFLEAHPDVTTRLLKVINESIYYLNENPDESYEWVAEEFQKDYDSLLVNYAASKYSLGFTDTNAANLRKVADFLYDERLISEPFSLNSGIDLSYLVKAGVLEKEVKLPE